MNFVEHPLRPSTLLDLANILKFMEISATLSGLKICSRNSHNRGRGLFAEEVCSWVYLYIEAMGLRVYGFAGNSYLLIIPLVMQVVDDMIEMIAKSPQGRLLKLKASVAF